MKILKYLEYGWNALRWGAVFVLGVMTGAAISNYL